MADDADKAADLIADRIAAGLSSITSVIAPGISGQCWDCGETMPRLVGGRCGFCRDGRRPPLSHFDDERAPPAIIAAPAPAVEKGPIAMPVLSLATERKITFKGVALAEIDDRADQFGITFTIAAAELVEAGAKALAGGASLPVSSAASHSDAPCTVTEIEKLDPFEVALANVPDTLLAAEVARRLTTGVGTEDYDSAIARAETAENQLAAIKQLLGQGND